MKDYISLLSDIPAKHGGLIFEQLYRAALVASLVLRDAGLPLPGETKIPTFDEVRDYLTQMTNRAIDNYYSIAEKAPANAEVWGEDSDRLFTVVVTGPVGDRDVFTAEIEMNLLYAGRE